MITHLRYRLGTWLMMPHYAQLLRHYGPMADPAINPNGREEAQNCAYIAIGIQYALDPNQKR